MNEWMNERNKELMNNWVKDERKKKWMNEFIII